MKRLIIIFLAFFLLAINLSAQSLSLDSCVVLALQNNVKSKNAELKIEAAKEVKNQAVTKYFPNISANAAAFHALNPLVDLTINDLPNAAARDLLNTLYFEYGAALGLPNSLSLFKHGILAGVVAFQPVFAGGQIVNGNRLAQLGMEVASVQKQLADREIMLQTEENYWLVVSLQEKLKTIATAQTLLDTLARDANAAVEAGLIEKTDLLKVSLKQTELQSQQMAATNGLLLAKMALCQAVGVAYSDSLLLTDTVPDVVESPLAIYKEPTEATKNRPEMCLLDMSVKAENLKQKMTIGEALPLIGVGASYGYSRLLFDKNTMNGSLFATVKIPLTDWWTTSYKLKEQKINAAIAENNRRDLAEKMELQTQQAWNTLQADYQQVLLAKKMIENAQENLVVARQNYAAGLIPLSDLLEAETTHRQAVDSENDKKIAYLIQRKNYLQLVE